MDKDQDAVENETVADTADVVEIDSVQPEGEAEIPEEGIAPASKEDLTLLLEDARAKADDHWDQLVRVQAQMDNLRKRQERDLANAHKFALERFVNELLPVRDSMELGLNAVKEDSTDSAKLVEGTELTLKLFSDVMEKFNVIQINPEGEPFDPELHQAMAMQPRSDVPPNTVVTVVQRGYTLNDRLVRPAMVLVSQAAPGQVDEQA